MISKTQASVLLFQRAVRKRLTEIFIPSSILVVTALLSGAIAMWTTLRSSNDSIARYVSVWEEEVARNLLLKGDHELFEKIRTQIKDLASEVVSTQPKSASIGGECFAEQDVNVTLYGTPAGELRICRSPEKLLFRSLGSPVFSFGLLTGVLFALWLTRRRAREESTRAVNDLAIRVAHDIRAPLMALKIAATVAAGPPGADETASDDNRALIESATKRISGIADELLALSRPEVKKPELKIVAPLEKSIDVALQELIREKKQTAPMPIRFDVNPVRVMSGGKAANSSGDFERVISNLLQNSIEATVEKSRSSGGEVKPRISIDASESETQIAITIRDNGIGIPKDLLPRVGDIGFSHGKHGGNGIGLSSARRWARDCGGDLEIRSLEGTGTEVRLTLPRPQTPVDLQ
jgi:signal transduction histidine kinase